MSPRDQNSGDWVSALAARWKRATTAVRQRPGLVAPGPGGRLGAPRPVGVLERGGEQVVLVAEVPVDRWPAARSPRSPRRRSSRRSRVLLRWPGWPRGSPCATRRPAGAGGRSWVPQSFLARRGRAPGCRTASFAGTSVPGQWAPRSVDGRGFPAQVWDGYRVRHRAGLLFTVVTTTESRARGELVTPALLAGPQATALDHARYREVMGHYPTGVAVVTGISAEGEPIGMVVGTFTAGLARPAAGGVPAHARLRHVRAHA